MSEIVLLLVNSASWKCMIFLNDRISTRFFGLWNIDCEIFGIFCTLLKILNFSKNIATDIVTEFSETLKLFGI